MRPIRRLASTLTIGILVASAVLAGMLAPTAQAQTSQRCFPETGFCIEGRIREFWEQNGGLPVFGLPIGPQQAETIEGRQLQVQRFERNRLELHPENARPSDVLLGRLGADRLQQQGRDWQTFAKVTAAPAGCLFFQETGHTLCAPFLARFRANGLELDGKKGKTLAESIALFGLPLSEPQVETLGNGTSYTVQWFERARFESHPENAAPYDVLLGLLGNEVRDGAQQAPPPAADACAGVPEPVNGKISPARCVERGTRVQISVFGFQPWEDVGYWVTTPEGEIFGTVQTYSIGPTGAAVDLPVRTSDMWPGLWYWVFEGVTSGHKAIVYLKITAPSAPASQAPPSVNAVAEPPTGPAGTTFSFRGWGFQPGEMVGIYATMPDRSVFGAPFQKAADSRGEVTVIFTSGRGDPPGVWANTFEGVSSGRVAVAYFVITSP